MRTEISVKIECANKNDLIGILNLQKEAYLQEAEIYNDFNIQPLRQTIDSLQTKWKEGVILKATSDQKIVGSVRGCLLIEYAKSGS